MQKRSRLHHGGGCVHLFEKMEFGGESPRYVILSERSESKDLGSMITFAVESVRRFFDFTAYSAVSLRMTNLVVRCNSSTNRNLSVCFNFECRGRCPHRPAWISFVFLRVDVGIRPYELKFLYFSIFCIVFRKETFIFCADSAKILLQKEKCFLRKALDFLRKQKERKDYEEQQPDQCSSGS